MSEQNRVNPMISVYKWALGIAGTLLLIFGSFYINTVEKDSDRVFGSVTEQTTRILNHEQRITTLEESKRNQENLLREIRDKLDEVSRAINSKR